MLLWKKAQRFIEICISLGEWDQIMDIPHLFSNYWPQLDVALGACHHTRPLTTVGLATETTPGCALTLDSTRRFVILPKTGKQHFSLFLLYKKYPTPRLDNCLHRSSESGWESLRLRAVEKMNEVLFLVYTSAWHRKQRKKCQIFTLQTHIRVWKYVYVCSSMQMWLCVDAGLW